MTHSALVLFNCQACCRSIATVLTLSWLRVHPCKLDHMKDIFNKSVSDEVVSRIEKLTPEAQPHWGKMDAAQMLAHCNVTYEMAFTDKHPKPRGLMKLVVRMFVKNAVVSEKPYPRNSRTAPQFLISDGRSFKLEKTRLIAYVNQCQQLGAAYFDGKGSRSFGPLNTREWNNMFYKHLDHHLTQFGV
jgi:hypothetical protein